MTEIVRHEPAPLTMQEQMDFSRIVTEGDMVPQAYRGKPANAMIAIGLGQSMGLSPAESLYRIDVIQGKPTASAELIASNIRKAGHKLRVEVDEQNTSVRATVYRADDPEFPHSVVRDMAWAKAMGLTGKDNYKKQALTMLQWRAISGVGRLACPEALYGVAYTPYEITEGGSPARAPRTPQAAPEAGQVTVESISPDQWTALVEAGKAAQLEPAAVAALAADIIGAELRGPHDIPTHYYDDITAAINDIVQTQKEAE